jgi:hypothetical protein
MQYSALLVALVVNSGIAQAAFSTTCPQLYYTTGALEGDCYDDDNNWTFNYLEIADCLGVSSAGQLIVSLLPCTVHLYIVPDQMLTTIT